MENQQVNPKDIIKIKEDIALIKEILLNNKSVKEDLEFAKRTEEAYKRHESGELIEMDSDEFSKELEKW